MKTIEEVKNYLNAYGVNKKNANKIMGFLLGKGLIEKGEVINFRFHKDDDSVVAVTFDDFYEWFESDECPLCGLLKFLCWEQEKAVERGENVLADELDKYLWFLVESFGLEVEEVDEDEEDDEK
jgi:hypothetical protein